MVLTRLQRMKTCGAFLRARQHPFRDDLVVLLSTQAGGGLMRYYAVPVGPAMELGDEGFVSPFVVICSSGANTNAWPRM